MDFVSRETLEKWIFVESGYLEEFNEKNRMGLTVNQIELLLVYTRFLWETNQVINLVSRKDEINILRKHICHGLALSILSREYQFKSVLDLGTGGGIPGIPYAITHPDTSVILMDSIQKKITALESFIQLAGLKNTRAIRSRSEEWRQDQPVDAIFSRGVGTLKDMLNWTTSLRKATKGMVYLFLKGGDLEAEFSEIAGFMKNEIHNVQVKPVTFWGADQIGEDKSLIILETK